MNRFMDICALLGLILLCGCSYQGSRTDPPENLAVAGKLPDAPADSASFEESLLFHQALPQEHRDDLRAAADDALDNWRSFEREVDHEVDSRLRHWYHRDNPPTMDHRGFGLGNSIVDLKTATDLDPSFALAWGHLGRLCLEAGDLSSGRMYLEKAMLAARVEAESGRTLSGDQQLAIHRNLAWTLRDLGLWEEGLAAVMAGLESHPGDQELVLIKGLLLAGAGRHEEAMSLAVRMPALEYPQYDFLFRGLKNQTSLYANNWIKSQVILATGDVSGAYAALGDLSLYAYRGHLPFSSRYWQDAGLIAELARDPEAPTYYAVGVITGRYRSFFPLGPSNVGAQVLEFPHPRTPIFSSFGQRFYVGGSPIAYVAAQINQMSMGMFADQREQAAGRALQMLDILDRRGIRPDLCHALRGRVYYGTDDFQLARQELSAARSAFRRQGVIDPRTSMMLGLLDLRDNRYADAARMLEEALTEDDSYAVAWRSLGIALSHLGLADKALEAMDRAVAMDPWSVAGFYNRGLLRFQLQEFGPAITDFTRAQQLDPENHEVQRMLQMATNAGQAADPHTVALATAEAGRQPDPEQYAADMLAEIETFFAPADSSEGAAEVTEARLGELMAAYERNPDLRLRAVIAFALIEKKRLEEVQTILAPGWGADLTPHEELMLLYADRNLGERQRAEEVIQDLLAAKPGAGNPYLIVLATEAMRTGTDPVGNDYRGVTHGFFGWWHDARLNFKTSGSLGTHSVYDTSLWKQYRDDPWLEQAVWGMAQTPITSPSGGASSPSSQTATRK